MGYRARVIAEAEGDASRFLALLAEYRKAPAVTRQRLYIDAIEQVMQSTGKVLIDTDSGNNLLMLPLEQLFQQVGRARSADCDCTPGPVVGVRQIPTSKKFRPSNSRQPRRDHPPTGGKKESHNVWCSALIHSARTGSYVRIYCHRTGTGCESVWERSLNPIFLRASTSRFRFSNVRSR